jgi:NAD(P)-dependent dehydrogenase (short-subunit alcohol dehydrogenase family)
VRIDLGGRIAIVTGASRGIGRAVALSLAESGATVVAAARGTNADDTARLITERGGTALALPLEVTDPASVQALVDGTLARFGRIDILVNNAGATWGAPTLEFPLERWDQMFNINVRGVWILTQKVANVMKAQGGGNIINISSIMGFRGSDEFLHPAVPYNSTKAAINALTMNLAVKLAPLNIRVNAIAPGFFRTDMMAYIETPDFKESHDKAMELVPMRRFGDIDDMKGVVVFLASDASAYMTGHVLVNDGGFLAR